MYDPDEAHEHERQNEHEPGQGIDEIDLPASFLETAEDPLLSPEASASHPPPTGVPAAAAAEEEVSEDPKTPRDRLPALIKKFRERLDGKKQNPSGSLAAKSRMTQDRTRMTMMIAGGCIVAIVIFLMTFTRPATIHRVKDARSHPNLGRPENSGNDDGRSGVPLRSAAGVKPEDSDGKISDKDILNTSKLKPRSPHAAAPPSNPQEVKDYALNKVPFPKEGPPEPAPVPAAPVAEKYQPSLVFVRSGSRERNAVSAEPVSASSYTPVVLSAFGNLLPPGTRLVARLESR